MLYISLINSSGLDFIDGIFVLNLKRRSERFARVESLLKRHQLCALRYEAVDGEIVFPDPEYKVKMNPETGKPLQPTDPGYVLTPGEKGYSFAHTFFSHMSEYHHNFLTRAS